MVFGSIFDHLFDDFSMFFASLFRDHFLMIFLFFPNRFLNRANPKISKIHWVFICYSALGTFRKRSIFLRFSIPKSTYFCIIFHDFSWLFRHRFSHRFFHRFLMENGSQKSSISSWCGEPFCSLFATLSFMLILCWIWLTLGSLLAPVGSLWAPLGSLWAPFGSLLAHFWFPLAHFWCPWAYFCTPWGSIFSLLGPPDVIFHFFEYFRWNFHFFEYFRWNLTQNLIIWKCSLQIRFYWSSTSHTNDFRTVFYQNTSSYAPEPAKPLQITTCTLTFAWHTIFPGPERVYCRRQLR